ncbi:MAG: response regulator [Alphaproteobacteria bacterium]|nr:MAG: response regulator [Alphaproteobacteria bacterium]
MRILLAEDNADNRDMLSRRLARRGFDVSLAVDGAEAVRLARAQKPDLILMDISMPVMSGLEAIAAIRADADIAATPIIVLTAHAMADDRDMCLRAGADDFATKPIDFTALLAGIARWAGRGVAGSAGAGQ